MLKAWSAIIVCSGPGSELDQLEASGSLVAHQLLRDDLRSGQLDVPNDQALHRLGRLCQRLNRNPEAERAYHLALHLSGLPVNPQQPGCSADGCVGLRSGKPLAFCGTCFAWDPDPERSRLLKRL